MAIGLLPFFLGAAALNVLGGLSQARGQAGALAEAGGLAEADAVQAEEAAKFAERRSREASARGLGEIRARIAASGLPIAGSPLEVLAESTRQAELDAQAIRLGGAMQAKAFRRQGANLRGQARQVSRAGGLQALTSVLQAGGGFAMAGGEVDLSGLRKFRGLVPGGRRPHQRMTFPEGVGP